jgi:hypothetical protein
VGKATVIRQASAGGKALAESLSVKIKAEVTSQFRANPAMQTKVLEAKRRQVVNISQGFYGGLVKGIDVVLTNPLMRGFRAGGTVTRNVTLATPNTAGLPQAVPVQIRGEGAWAALNPRYAAGKMPPVGVVSKSYWRKTGDLATVFRAARPDNAELAEFGKFAKTRLVQGALPTGYLAEMVLRVDFPAIRGNAQVDRLIRGSFASRVALRHVVTKGMIDEAYRGSSLNHLLLAEGGPFARPWVAAFSADVGRKYIEALRLLASR